MSDKRLTNKEGCLKAYVVSQMKGHLIFVARYRDGLKGGHQFL